MEGYVYILKSEKLDRYYIGSSDDPDRRLAMQHNRGFVRSTKPGMPWGLVFKQGYINLQTARKVEYKLKQLKSRIIIEKIINEGYCKISG